MSINEKQDVPTMVEHEQALKVYIDALLLEPAVDMPVEEKQEAPSVGTRIEAEIGTESQVDQEVAAQTEKEDGSFASDEALECLLFKVAGSLTLAVPLVRLSGILQWNGETTQVPGHAEWFLGLVPNRGRQVKVIDMAKFVIPENHKSRQVPVFRAETVTDP